MHSFWPARRDLNPQSPESESVALSSCATGGNLHNALPRSRALIDLVFVSVRITFLPTPCVFTHFFNTAFSLPTKKVIRLVSASVNFAEVTRTTWVNNVWYVNARRFNKSVAKLEYASAVTCTKVNFLAPEVVKSPSYCLNVTESKVNYVDIVTNTCAVRGVIVVSKYVKLLKLTYSNR